MPKMSPSGRYKIQLDIRGWPEDDWEEELEDILGETVNYSTS
jgi:hypothetical protein